MVTQLERVREFHEHLDVCRQCAHHPFDLCPVGAKLLKEAALNESVEEVSESGNTRRGDPHSRFVID